jgi:hypothetical protein
VETTFGRTDGRTEELMFSRDSYYVATLLFLVVIENSHIQELQNEQLPIVPLATLLLPLRADGQTDGRTVKQRQNNIFLLISSTDTII